MEETIRRSRKKNKVNRIYIYWIIDNVHVGFMGGRREKTYLPYNIVHCAQEDDPRGVHLNIHI